MKKEFEVISQIIRDNKKVLDVGCGDGTLMEYLKNHQKNDVRGLEPGKTYYYYFSALEKKSIIGKTRTASLNSNQINFAVVSCSDYQRGYFNSYAALAKERNLDAVIHLGDYIYEYKARDYSHGTFNRLHIPDKELISLDDYRTRYSQYKLDPDIIAAHSSPPFIVIWDDHDTSNNTYMTGAQNHQSLLEEATVPP